MTIPKTIKIDGTEYVRKTDVAVGPPTDLRIVVADRGWVFIGPTTQGPNGELTISPAKVIRYWGTDDKRPGLGWLAMNGPTEKTKLDPAGTVRLPAHSVVATLDVSADKWA